MDISGQTVLLTGASGGLGAAIARDLHGAGARLVLTGRRVEVLEPLAAELGATIVTADLRDAPDLRRLVDAAGAIDILIANAALPGSGWLRDLTEEQIDSVLDVNLRAPIMLTQGIAPGMVERGAGHIAFISSLSGRAATPGTSMYNATKFGLRGFALSMRQELRAAGIGVSLVSPGFISEVGMFADAGVKLPPGVRRAIERDRAEIDVAAVGLLAGSRFAHFAPETAARLSARLGARSFADRFARGQAEKR
jgi:NADP-dependent 3-hydroxy acid dehydrogenase YdfG